jgi:hypothetical protein
MHQQESEGMNLSSLSHLPTNKTISGGSSPEEKETL